MVSVYQGWLTAMLGVPSFVVTLGGLMSLRGAAFLVADGKTQPVSDDTFLQLGGGYDGGIGVTATWVLTACVSLVLVRSHAVAPPRLHAPRDAQPSRCGWIVLVAAPVVLLTAFAAAMNSYLVPTRTPPRASRSRC